MSFISILIPMLVLLMVYYVGMIFYDTYIEKLKRDTPSGNVESEIDISSELDGFAPIDVNRKEEAASAPIRTCCAIEIGHLRSMMENVAYGKNLEGLDNISFKCLSNAS